MAEQIVDAAAPTERSVDELRCEGPVGAGECAAAQVMVQLQIRVGAGALHAIEHSDCEQARLGRLRTAGGATSNSGSAAVPAPARLVRSVCQ